MLSTAWSRTDPFWTVWASDDPSWLRLKATADVVDIYSQEFLEQERRQLGESAFNREYLGIPGGASVSPFDWELYQRAAQVPVPQVAVRSGLGPPIQPAGLAPQPSQPYRPMRFDPDNARSWRYFSPPIIAHDVGRSRDRSTAVVGGGCPEGPLRTGTCAAVELPQNIAGTARAGALAAIDRQHGGNNLIVADLSNDETYGEVLVETFGERVIGLHITRFGDGMSRELRAYPRGRLWVYTIGRTYLFELLHRELLSDAVRLSDTPEIRLAYEQLSLLNVEYRDSGTVYTCAPGQHDDLGISLAMLVWAARHPDLALWCRARENAVRPRRPPRPRFNWAAVT